MRPLRRPAQPTGFVRDGIDLTAARIGGTVTGAVDATGCDIGVYNPTRVTNADIHGARYYGVVVNGGTRQHDQQQGPPDRRQPVRRHAARPRHPLHQRRDGTISGNKVYDFQKNGIEVRGLTADASVPPATSPS